MAVYTEVTADEMAGFVARYDVGPLTSFRGIQEGVENTNYFVETARGRFILTLYEKRVKTEDLPFFLGLMEHLAAAGIRCPLPLHDRSGQLLGGLKGRPAALVTFVEGASVRRPEPRHCAAVGARLADLHAAGRNFELRRENALGVAGWRPLFERFRDRADDILPDLSAIIARELDGLERAWPDNLPTGVVHADLFPDNVFFEGDVASGLIDFYFACNDAFAYDLSVCLNAWCFDADLTFDGRKARALLDGYSSVRPLTREERAALPLLARGSALRFLLTRAYDWLNTPAGALVKPHDPGEYLRKLQFHQTVDSPAVYGLDASA